MTRAPVHEMILRDLTVGDTSYHLSGVGKRVEVEYDPELGLWTLSATSDWSGWDFVGFGGTFEAAFSDFTHDFHEAWTVYVEDCPTDLDPETQAEQGRLLDLVGYLSF